jgi:hypothetical protein
VQPPNASSVIPIDRGDDGLIVGDRRIDEHDVLAVVRTMIDVAGGIRPVVRPGAVSMAVGIGAVRRRREFRDRRRALNRCAGAGRTIRMLVMMVPGGSRRGAVIHHPRLEQHDAGSSFGRFFGFTGATANLGGPNKFVHPYILAARKYRYNTDSGHQCRSIRLNAGLCIIGRQPLLLVSIVNQ